MSPRCDGEQEGRAEGKHTKRPGGQPKDSGISQTGLVVCLLPTTRGIDPVCHAALVFGAQTFVKTCPACPRRPIIVDSKDIIRKRDREGWEEGGRGGTRWKRDGKGAPWSPRDLMHYRARGGKTWRAAFGLLTKWKLPVIFSSSDIWFSSNTDNIHRCVW